MRTNFNISLSQTENVLLKRNKALETQTASGNALVSWVLCFRSLLPSWMFFSVLLCPCGLCPSHGLVLGLLFLLLTDTRSLSSSFTPVDSTTRCRLLVNKSHVFGPIPELQTHRPSCLFDITWLCRRIFERHAFEVKAIYSPDLFLFLHSLSGYQARPFTKLPLL